MIKVILNGELIIEWIIICFLFFVFVNVIIFFGNGLIFL